MTIVAQDKYEPYEDVSEIDIPFPDEKYKKLLKLCNLEEDSSLGPHQMSQIFVNAIYRFLTGEFSLEDLSSISSSLWFEIEGDSAKKFDELGSALYAADEMSFYVRRIYKPGGKHGGFERWMVEVMEYYHRHREQVVKEEE